MDRKQEKTTLGMEDLEILAELKKLKKALGDGQSSSLSQTQILDESIRLSENNYQVSAGIAVEAETHGFEHCLEEDPNSQEDYEKKGYEETAYEEETESRQVMSPNLSNGLSAHTLPNSTQYHFLNENVQLSLRHPARISSPLKQSYIPESIVFESDSEEEGLSEDELSSANISFPSVRDVINAAFESSASDNLCNSIIVEEPEDEEQQSKTEDDIKQNSEGGVDGLTPKRSESLLDQIYELKALYYSARKDRSLGGSSDYTGSVFANVQTFSELLTSKGESNAKTYDGDQVSETRSIETSSPTKTNMDQFKGVRKLPSALDISDVKQLKSRFERKNAFVAKFNALKNEETGLTIWIRITMQQPQAQPPKYYKKMGGKSNTDDNNSITSGSTTDLSVQDTSNPQSSLTNRESSITPSTSISSSRSSKSSRMSFDQPSSIRHKTSLGHTSSTRSKTPTFLSSIGRRTSLSKASSKSAAYVHAPVMYQVSPNSSSASLSSSPKPPPTPNTLKKQRRFSLQSVTSRFSFGSNSSSASEEKFSNGSTHSLDTLVEVDEKALNKLCDIIPHADRDVLREYLQKAGGKDDLLAVGLYMRDFKNDWLVN